MPTARLSEPRVGLARGIESPSDNNNYNHDFPNPRAASRRWAGPTVTSGTDGARWGD